MNNDSMNSRFKSYNYKLFVASLVALAPLGANAKTAQTSESDTASADKEMVQVAYRKVAKDDILGGVSVVDVENLMKKNYHTYSLDNMLRLCRWLEWQFSLGYGCLQRWLSRLGRWCAS